MAVCVDGVKSGGFKDQHTAIDLHFGGCVIKPTGRHGCSVEIAAAVYQAVYSAHVCISAVLDAGVVELFKAKIGNDFPYLSGGDGIFDRAYEFNLVELQATLGV